MSDEPNTETTQAEAPVSSGQPEAPVQSQTPEPVSAPQPVEDRSQRYIDQINGMKPYVDPLRIAGVTTPEGVQGLIAARDQLQQLTDRGLSIDALIGGQVQQNQAPQQEAVEAPLTMGGLGQFLDNRDASRVHADADATATNGLRAIASEYDPENSDVFLPTVMEAGKEYMAQHGVRYPMDHPMYDQAYLPPSAQDIVAIKAIVQGKVDRLRGIYSRQQVAGQLPNSVTPQAGGMNGEQVDAGISTRDAKKARFNQVLARNMAELNGDSISNA